MFGARNEVVIKFHPSTWDNSRGYKYVTSPWLTSPGDDHYPGSGFHLNVEFYSFFNPIAVSYNWLH